MTAAEVEARLNEYLDKRVQQQGITDLLMKYVTRYSILQAIATSSYAKDGVAAYLDVMAEGCMA